jgi:hypothetical protein
VDEWKSKSEARLTQVEHLTPTDAPTTEVDYADTSAEPPQLDMGQ